jgi:hypothetical protein
MYQELVADNKKVMVNLYLIYFSSFTIPLINGLNQSIPLNLDTNELIFGQVSICISLFVLYLYQIYSTPFIEFEKIQYRVLNKKFEKSDLSNYSLAYVLFKKSTIKRLGIPFSCRRSKLATIRSIPAKYIYKRAGATAKTAQPG